MSIFSKKETVTQNITYMAIMSTINVVFVLLGNYVPLLMFLFIFILPLSSTLVSLLCKKKYYIIYFITTLLLCFLVSLTNISDTFFFIIPSLIIGFLFAVEIEKQTPTLLIILSSTLLQVGLSYLFLPLINSIYNRNFIIDFATIFGLGNYKYLHIIAPAFIFIISFLQNILTYIIIKNEIFKFGYSINDKMFSNLIISLITLFIFSLLILCSFFYNTLMLLLLFIFIILSISLIYDVFLNYHLFSLILIGISFLINIFLFAILYKYFPDPYRILLISIFFILGDIISFINSRFSLKKT